MSKRPGSGPRNPDHRQSEQEPGAGDPELNQRLQRLNAALDKARPKDQSQPSGSHRDTSTSSGMALAFRLGSEFVAGTLVGAMIGWGIDTFFSVAPWGMIVFTLAGFAAGVRNMMRAAGETGKQQPPRA